MEDFDSRATLPREKITIETTKRRSIMIMSKRGKPFLRALILKGKEWILCKQNFLNVRAPTKSEKLTLGRRRFLYRYR